jgi:hypothetical protein
MDSHAWAVHAIKGLGSERLETYHHWGACQGQAPDAKLAPGNEFLNDTYPDGHEVCMNGPRGLGLVGPGG